jgi:hypothetical protein
MSEHETESGASPSLARKNAPYETIIAHTFEAFYAELVAISAENAKRGIAAMKPECWKNMGHYYQWQGKTVFESKLSQAFEDLGVVITSNFYGAQEGIIFPIKLPLSAFTVPGGEEGVTATREITTHG